MSGARVAVIGAGPYGLALAAHLRPLGVAHRIFGSPMSTWIRHMPAGMFLKSEGHASSIADPAGRFTLPRFCAESGREYGEIGLPVSLETFVEYGGWFQRSAVPEVEETQVTGVSSDDHGGFVLELESGESLQARHVVLATGVAPYRYLAPELRGLPANLVTHSSEHMSFARFAGKEVAVVGAGQSALESAALLHEAGALPRVVTRAPSLRWNMPPDRSPSMRERLGAPQGGLGRGWKLWTYSTLPQVVRRFPERTRVQVAQGTLGPAGGWWLRERFEPHVPVLANQRLVAATPDDDRVRLTLAPGNGDQALTVDHVVAGTGYRVAVDRLDFLAPELRAQLALTAGSPRLSSHFESSVRGLYFVGLPAANTFGPVMRFVCGSGFAARRVTARVRGG